MENSAAAAVASELSDRVLVRRWPDHYTVVGRAEEVRDAEEVAEGLAKSSFMVPWMASKILEALRAGEVFKRHKPVERFGEDASWRGREDRVVAEYRAATREEVLRDAEGRHVEEVTGRAPTRHAQEKGYELHYKSTDELAAAYDALPRQARVVLDLLHKSGRGTFSEASVAIILGEGREELKTKQDPMLVFGFYRKRLVDQGHLGATK